MVDRNYISKGLLAFALLCCLVVLGFLPLVTIVMRSVENSHGDFVGMGNYLRYVNDPNLLQTLWNTAWVSVVTTLLTVSSAFFFAYGLQRTTILGKWIFRILALSPLFAPTLMHGIALVYLFGHKGLLTTGFFGVIPGFHIPIYGALGIIIAEWVCNFPSAFLLLTVALSLADRRLRESAEMVGASRWLRFRCITLPSIRYGLLSAAITVFTGSFVDFGAPKVIGGSFRVLSVEIYKQVVGQQNFNMGAAISLILALPSLAALLMDVLQKRSSAMTYSSRSLPQEPTGGMVRNLFFFAGNSVIAGSILIVNVVVVYASLVRIWPYHLELVFSHYDFRDMGGGGIDSFKTSLLVSILTAIVGTILAFFIAWTTQRSRLSPWWTWPIRFLTLLPLSLPGMVIGIAYIFFFNAASNPFHFIYNTLWMLVVANVFHFIAVPYLTCSSAIAKLDPELESASESLGVSTWRSLRCVTFPLTIPALSEVFLYFFMNSMVTVSAVIFLFSAHAHLAAVAVVDMEDAGDVAAAASMSVLIFFTNVGVRLLYSGVRRALEIRSMQRSLV